MNRMLPGSKWSTYALGINSLGRSDPQPSKTERGAKKLLVTLELLSFIISPNPVGKCIPFLAPPKKSLANHRTQTNIISVAVSAILDVSRLPVPRRLAIWRQTDRSWQRGTGPEKMPKTRLLTLVRGSSCPVSVCKSK